MGLACEPGDTFILCSDGLANMLEDRELLEVVQKNPKVGDVPKKLIDLANDRGGDDNITVIAVRMQS
jgi:protein phosphatase